MNSSDPMSYPVDRVELSAVTKATRAPQKRAEISPAAEVATSKPVSGPVGFASSTQQLKWLILNQFVHQLPHYPVNSPGSIALDRECGHFTIAH